MCAGQYWDTLGDGQPHTEQELTAIHDQKTGALLRAACMMGVIAASGSCPVGESCLDVARSYASQLGLAFQIQDDILDATSTTQALGKPVGSDAANGKTTFVTLLGVAHCQELVQEHTQLAKQVLDRGAWPGDTGFLSWLADQLSRRSK
jgi:geranylgeranyl pyrophosphate synthase